MSRFHESVRDILQDVNAFLLYTLQYERISASTLAHRETILMKLTHLSQEYEQLHLNIPEHPGTPPYIDMKGTEPDYVLEGAEENQYGSIADSPFDSVTPPTPRSVATPPPPALPVFEGRILKKGYLEKKADLLGGLLAPYQRRWCTIHNHYLTYYSRPTEKKELGHINLTSYEVRPVVGQREGAFELYCPGKKSYHFASSSEQDMIQWINVIQKVTKVHNKQMTDVTPILAIDMKQKTEDMNEEPIYDDGLSSPGGICYVENPQEWYLALWDCNADDQIDLEFDRGDLIHIVNKLYDDWWVGELRGKLGLVPKAYLMEAYDIILDSNAAKDIDV